MFIFDEVKKIVDRYYDNDGAVGADTELLAFVTELHTQVPRRRKRLFMVLNAS